MSILRHIAGVAAELFTLKDPYDVYVPPTVISDNGNVQIVRANNQQDATRHLHGTAIAGDKTVVATRIGHNTWMIHTEYWKNRR